MYMLSKDTSQDEFSKIMSIFILSIHWNSFIARKHSHYKLHMTPCLQNICEKNDTVNFIPKSVLYIQSVTVTSPLGSQLSHNTM